MPDSLTEAVARLPAHWHGQYFEVVDSTQDEARAAAQTGAPGRSLFVANYQRAGRGRQGRVWLAAPGQALLVSMLFRAEASEPRPWRFTSLVSLSLAEAIEHLVKLTVAIKWPNDLMLADRKVAGVLAETTWNGSELQVIVGVGLNVAGAVPVPTATSLESASGQHLDRGLILGELVNRLDRWQEQPYESVFAAWEGRLWRRLQRVRLAESGREREAIVVAATPDGLLRLRLDDGGEVTTATGELLA